MAYKNMKHSNACPYCNVERKWDGAGSNVRCDSCGNGTKENNSGGLKVAPILEIGGFYSRDEITQLVNEDCCALSDAQLAKYATKKLNVKVIYVEGFLGLVYLIREKSRVRKKSESLSALD